jgi:xanthine dehydrogenase accessory factor
MRAWLAPLADVLERGEAAMLVHVAELRGSGPREVGAQMLVTEAGISGTIGGGELERTAMLRARELLQSGRAGLLRLALGPELSQCCGGSVMLAFEPFAPADLAWVRRLVRAAEEPVPIIRRLRIDAAGVLRRDWERGGDGPEYRVESRDADATIAAVEIRERVNPPAPALFLFGAGHVGRAVAGALVPLGFAITWIDGRADMLPEPPLPGVKQLALAMPELAVEEAPPETVFLVMTHSHPLDEAICEAVLRRADLAYLGLIGSSTKRARFVKRLGEAGIPPDALKRLVCPIGLPAIRSKMPAAIAASVAADLLIRREKNVLAIKGHALNGR